MRSGNRGRPSRSSGCGCGDRPAAAAPAACRSSPVSRLSPSLPPHAAAGRTPWRAYDMQQTTLGEIVLPLTGVTSLGLAWDSNKLAPGQFHGVGCTFRTL